MNLTPEFVDGAMVGFFCALLFFGLAWLIGKRAELKRNEAYIAELESMAEAPEPTGSTA